MDTSTYVEKFSQLKKWHPEIIAEVRKDLKKDHLKKDPLFLKQYLKGRPLNKLTNEDLEEGYSQAVLEHEEVGEFIASRWLLKHSDIYYHFEEALKAINTDITKAVMDQKTAEKVTGEAAEEFGPVETFLFCHLNAVELPKGLLDKLEKKASQALQEQAGEEELKSLEAIKNRYEQQIARINDRYEKKLSSMERKYHQDVEALKKQIGTLQRKAAA